MQLTFSLGASASPSLRTSLVAVNKITTELMSVLDRTPAQVGGYTMGLAQQVDHLDDSLFVDRVLLLLARMNKHLDNIITALQAKNLYDNHHATHGHTTTLIEALATKWDSITAKRRNDNFLETNFGREFDNIGKKIQTIYNYIPVYTQQLAA